MKNSLKYFTFSQKNIQHGLLIFVSIFVSGISIIVINDLMIRQFPLKAELLNALEPTVFTYTMFLVIFMSAMYQLKKRKWYFFSLYIIVSCIVLYLVSTITNVFWII